MNDEKKLIGDIRVGYEDLISNIQSNDVIDNVEYHDRWEGTVVDDNDPEKLGRVKIRIIGFYDEIDINNIPWAQPDIMFIGSTCGNFVVPLAGTMVRGYFDQGDPQKPMYDSIAFAKSNIDDAMGDSDEDYPHKIIMFQSDDGDVCTLNRKSGEFAFVHRTGASIIYKSSGEVQIDTGSDPDSGEGSDLVFTVLGNMIANIDGSCDIKTTKGDITVDSDLGMVLIGKNAAKQFINNLPTCLVTGAPHFIGVTNAKV